VPASKSDENGEHPVEAKDLTMKAVWGAVGQVRTELRAHVQLNDQAHAFTKEKVEKIESGMEKMQGTIDDQGKEQVEQGKVLAEVATHVKHLVKAADRQDKVETEIVVAKKKSAIKFWERVKVKVFYVALAAGTALAHYVARHL
jgi:hypothetical protein